MPEQYDMNTQFDVAKYSLVASSEASRATNSDFSAVFLTFLVLYRIPLTADSFVAGNLGDSVTVSFKEPR